MCTLAQRTPRACKLSWFYCYSESCASEYSYMAKGVAPNSWNPSSCQITWDQQACQCLPCARHHTEAQLRLL